MGLAQWPMPGVQQCVKIAATISTKTIREVAARIHQMRSPPPLPQNKMQIAIEVEGVLG